MLAAIQQEAAVDYSLVVLFGLGHFAQKNLPWKEFVLVLENGEDVFESELNLGTQRSTLIVDCSAFANSSNRAEIPTARPVAFPAPHNPAQSREAYDDSIGVAEVGRATVFAFCPYEEKGETWSFTTHFLTKIKSWAQTHQGVITLPDSVDLLGPSAAHTTGGEAARYNGGRRRRHFPLAVGSLQ